MTESIKQAFDAQMMRARYAFNQEMWELCRVLLAGAERMAENMEKLIQEQIGGKHETE